MPGADHGRVVWVYPSWLAMRVVVHDMLLIDDGSERFFFLHSALVFVVLWLLCYTMVNFARARILFVYASLMARGTHKVFWTLLGM
jgi:hypothetical protein